MPRYACPYPEFQDHWIELPDRWEGRHAQRDYEAQKKIIGKGWPSVYEEFTRAMAILEDWFLPSISPNPEKWNLDGQALNLVVWVGKFTMLSYSTCFHIPKKAWLPLQNGQATATNESPPGTLETTESPPG